MIDEFAADDELQKLSYRSIFSKGQTVTYQNLKLTPLLTLVELGPGMVAYRLPDDPDGTLNFWNIWQPHSSLNLHDHDCPEKITIFSGLLLCKASVYTVGEVIRYAPYVPHLVRSLSAVTTFLVQFKPPL